MSANRRILWTIVALIAAALAASGIADSASDDYSDEAFKRALLTFAVARTLNGVISVAQGTELAVEPGGVGVNLTVGQILDPVNDLIEQFSSVMLVAASSIGLQNVLLNMTGWWGVTALLLAAGALLLAACWWPRASSRFATIAMRIFILTAFVRFALPLLIVASHFVFNVFLADEHDAATAVLEATSEEIEIINDEDAAPDTTAADESFMDRLGNMIESSMQQLDVSGRIERLRASASNASEQVIRLIVIFVLQTILVPIGTLWLLLEIVKGLISRGNPTRSDPD